jgi:hypothetical protein
MDEVVGVRAFCPAPRSLVELVRKDADGEWDGDGFGVEERGLVLPVPSPWSIANAAQSIGESANPYSVCGRVDMICA